MAMRRPHGRSTSRPRRRLATPAGARAGRCSVCHRVKGKVHRSRKTGRLVCAGCADRARLRVTRCVDCRRRKLIQARGQCYACYKRDWRSRRGGAALVRAVRRTRATAERRAARR
jgi:recombinational DNA repair protein (RecF pathway)